MRAGFSIASHGHSQAASTSIRAARLTVATVAGTRLFFLLMALSSLCRRGRLVVALGAMMRLCDGPARAPPVACCPAAACCVLPCTISHPPCPAFGTAAAAAVCVLLSSTAPAHAVEPPNDWLPASVSTPASAAAATATAAAKPANWRASYPFPQCIGTTLKYDVSFVGKVQYVQVGEWRVLQLSSRQLGWTSCVRLCTRVCACSTCRAHTHVNACRHGAFCIPSLWPAQPGGRQDAACQHQIRAGGSSQGIAGHLHLWCVCCCMINWGPAASATAAACCVCVHCLPEAARLC